MQEAISITLPKWYDLHVHLRQEALLKHTIADHLRAGCAGVLAMPNTKPPVATIHRGDNNLYNSIEAYRDDIIAHGGDKFEQLITPLYLCSETSSKMIEAGANSGLLQACKYYPPHGTTGAEFSSTIGTFIDNGVLKAMEDNNIVLCVHGEAENLCPEQYFEREHNAEEIFYHEMMPRIREQFPNLKIVGEHLTTKAAVDFVKQHPENTAATITPQHLLFTVANLLQGLKYHLYCLPLLKFCEDRQSLRDAVTDKNNTQFFAGTDSAPHTHKATDCGCAAGCYTASVGPQLYAQAFEDCGLNFTENSTQQLFKRFLCEIGANFYGLPISTQTFTLKKEVETIEAIKTPHGVLTPLPVGITDGSSAELSWRVISNT